MDDGTKVHSKLSKVQAGIVIEQFAYSYMMAFIWAFSDFEIQLRFYLSKALELKPHHEILIPSSQLENMIKKLPPRMLKVSAQVKKNILELFRSENPLRKMRNEFAHSVFLYDSTEDTISFHYGVKWQYSADGDLSYKFEGRYKMSEVKSNLSKMDSVKRDLRVLLDELETPKSILAALSSPAPRAPVVLEVLDKKEYWKN